MPDLGVIAAAAAESKAKRVAAEVAAAETARLYRENPPKNGEQGPEGERGVQGLQGPEGTKGDSGPRGTKGDSIKGDTGPGFTWRGAFKRGTSYQTDDVVSFEGSSYIATRPTKATPPGGAWQLLARKGKDGKDASQPIWVGGGGGGGAPSGVAGGVLSGTYPNPGFASDMATQAELDAHEADTTNVHGITNTANLYAAGGTDVAVADGGTGASTAAGARTNLGLVIGTNVAAPDPAVSAAGRVYASLTFR